MSFRWAARAALAGRSRAYWILVVITLVLAGLSASCGNSSSSSESASHNAYVTLLQKGSVALLHLNNSTGALSLGAQTPAVLGTSPTGLALDSGKKFLYVGNAAAGANSVSIFNIAGDGTLTQGSDATAIGASPRALAIDASGKYLLMTTNFADKDKNVSVFSLDSGSGAITLVGNFGANPSPNDLKISPTGNFVYVSDSDEALITAFSLNPANGNLTSVAGSPFDAGAGVAGLAIDSGSHFLYAANTSDNTISAFVINPATGALSPIAGSPYSLGTATAPRAIAMDPSGAFLYVANQGSNNVSAFTITAGTGQLVTITGSPFSAGTQPVFVLAEPAGQFLYVGNQSSTNVSGFSYDSTTGVLKAISGSPFTVGSAPGAMTITH
jgi:6-phosphogluconolactonase (cycloisomerase 2 family)